MNNAESQYFMLMRAAMWGSPVAFDAPPDWEGIVRIARHHTTNVLVADVASRLTDNVPDASLLREMKTEMRLNLVNQMELRRILTTALTALHSKDIKAVLLKGFGLASLYPNPSLRQFGDIDLFVGLKDFHKACEVLKSLPGGYNWGEEQDVGRHYNIEFGRHPMEIHRVSADVIDPKEHAAYAEAEREGLEEHPQRINIDGVEVSIPSKEFMVFFTFFHAWHHFMTSGVGWRQLSDVAMTLHAYYRQLDTEKLHQWLAAMHLMQPWQTFGYLMVTYLGLPEAEMPFYDASCRRRAQRLYVRVMAEGNFRRPNRYRRSRPRKAGLGRKLHAFVGVFVDFFQLASVFPDQAFREMRAKLRSATKKNLQK